MVGGGEALPSPDGSSWSQGHDRARETPEKGRVCGLYQEEEVTPVSQIRRLRLREAAGPLGLAGGALAPLWPSPLEPL